MILALILDKKKIETIYYIYNSTRINIFQSFTWFQFLMMLYRFAGENVITNDYVSLILIKSYV